MPKNKKLSIDFDVFEEIQKTSITFGLNGHETIDKISDLSDSELLEFNFRDTTPSFKNS